MKKIRGLISLCSILICSFMTTYSYGGTWDPNTQTYKPSTYQVVFYDSSSCKGEPYIVFDVINTNPKEIARLSEYDWNDKISCIVIGIMTRVTVYEHKNYEGRSSSYQTSSTVKTISGSGNWWNNKISSIRIQRN